MTIGVTNKSQIKFKSGLKADINTTATKALAVEGEPHYTTDDKGLWIFDGTNNYPVTPIEHTPSSASDTGTQGQIAWDANYLYVCTATDTWKRVALSTW